MTEPNSNQNVQFASNGRTVHGYLAEPSQGGGPGVVVIQEWWGLTSHIKEMADRLAEAGFVALAPDLYGGATTHDSEEAMRLMQELPVEQAIRDLAGSVDHLLGHPAVSSSTVGAVGFCMGGGFVLSLAAAEGDRVSAAIPFYGLPADPLPLGSITAHVQGHYGRQDQGVPIEAAEAVFGRLEAALSSSVELHTYDAGHAFVNDENLLGTHDPAAAERAWARALGFLADHVV